jgi:broad specificity phosphatase PhoE
VEPKARETGEIAAQKLGLPCRTAKDLHEHEREAGGILTHEEFTRRIADLFARPEAFVFGLETAQGALNRFSVAVESVMANYPDQNVAIVSHGTVMSLYYGVVTGEDPYRFWSQLGLPAFYTVSWPECVVLSFVKSI